MRLIAGLVAAYLVGAVPTSYLVARARGIDLRTHGSKNLGATNLYRVMGWKYAVPVGALDVAKGAFPVLWLAPRVGEAAWLPVLVGVAAVIGHVYSVFVGFKGGKGVATAAGVVLALAPLPLLVSAVFWSLLVWLTGYVSLGSLVSAAVFPLAAWLLQPRNPYVLGAGVALAAFIMFTHRGNVRRLLNGTEARFRHGRAVP